MKLLPSKAHFFFQRNAFLEEIVQQDAVLNEI